MRRIPILFSVFLLSFQVGAQLPRLLVTTDMGDDADDQQSLARLMVYSNELDIKELRHTCMKFILMIFMLVSQR